jgi:hypothetical protein
MRTLVIDQISMMPNRKTAKLGLNALITLLISLLLAYADRIRLMYRLL